MVESQKRQIAYKARIRDLLNGRYVKEEGWMPNYVVTGDGREISRVNIIATVVAKSVEESYQSIVIDDGTGRISVRWFEKGNLFEGVEIGDIVLLIGRPREYGSEKYILPEILKRVKDYGWIKVRAMELGAENQRFSVVKNQGFLSAENRRFSGKEKIIDNKKAEEVTIKEEVVENHVESADKEVLVEKIIDYIKKHDSGEGVNFDELLKIGEEKVIGMLLKEGEIFEIKPGRFKVLE